MFLSCCFGLVLGPLPLEVLDDDHCKGCKDQNRAQKVQPGEFGAVDQRIEDGAQGERDRDSKRRYKWAEQEH